MGGYEDTNFIKPRVYVRYDELMRIAYMLPVLCSTGLALFLSAYKIPKQFTAIVIGGLLGIAAANFEDFEEHGESMWNVETVEVIYYPFLILRLMCAMDMHVFSKSLHQILIISICTTYIPGLAAAYAFLFMKGLDCSIQNVFLTGLAFTLNAAPNLLAIANPVKNFEVLLCSEAAYTIAWSLPLIRYSIMSNLGLVTSISQFGCLITRSIIMAILIGCFIGISISALFKYIYIDLFNTVAALMGVTYFTYCLCLFEGGCNGALGAITALYFVLKEKSSTDMSPEVLTIIKLIYSSLNTSLTAGISTIYISHAFKYGSISDIGPGVATYILLNIVRAITFLLMAAVLSRIGYGLNMNSLWAMSLGMSKGAGPLMLLLKYEKYSIDEKLTNSLYSVIVILLLLMSLVNELIAHNVLKALGFLKLSNLHQNNIGIAIRNILESRFTMLSMVKMNRFFSDANWPIIYTFTDIKVPNSEKDANLSDFTYFYSDMRKTQCPSCYKTVTVEPTAAEYKDMIREVRLRVLKMNRVSFMRQYEQGIINKNELMGLLQAVETAFDSEDKELKIDELIENFLTKSFAIKLKKCLLRSQVIKTELQPENRCRKYCYKSSRSFGCLIPLYLVDIAYLVFAIIAIVTVFITTKLGYNVCLLFYLIFTAEEIVIILGLSIDSIRQGFRRYLRNYWNVLSFIVLLVHYSEVFLLPVFYFSDWAKPLIVFKYLRLVRTLVLIKIILICEKLVPNYLTCLENFTDSRICYSFTVGRGLIVSYDEIINALTNLCDNLHIRQAIKESVVSKKLRIMEKLTIIQKERPWISVTVETKQALGATLKGMHDALDELKSAGYVDKHEYSLLMNMLKERQKVVATYKSVDPPMPKTIFFEVGYLSDDPETLEFIYDNILMKVWKTGEIICDVGEVIPGVFVIVAGVFKMTYKPQEKYLKRLREHGALPVKNLSNFIFDEEQVDYYMIGNSIGELSNLTNRENSCTYVAHTPCQAFIIPVNILYDAIKRSNDPVNGLRPRMWKYLVTDLAKKVLLTTYGYHSLSHLTENLERAIVPDLQHFKILALTDLVEDVILIDGIIVDYSTRDIFIAPCYIPRSVQRMILSDLSIPGSVPTILMIFPMRDVDGYDVMLKAEMQSEMITNSEESLYIPLSRFMEEKSVKKKVSLMMLKKAMGNKIFKTTSQSMKMPKAIKSGVDVV